MKKTRIVLMALALFAIAVPAIALADSTTNEAIEGIAVEFTGQGENTYITIQVALNENAEMNPDIKVKAWIDEKNDENLVTDSIGNDGYYFGDWDINAYAEGPHTLYVAFDSDTLDEATTDLKTDNQLSLVFGTQEATLKELIELYGHVQFFWSKTVRTEANGWFACLDSIPLYTYIFLIVAIIVIAVVIRRLKKKGKLGGKAKSVAYTPYNYARQGYQNHQNYRNEFR